MDVWIAINPTNAQKVARTIEQFGFASPALTPELFLQDKLILRMGVEPYRLEVTTHIDGVKFDECFAERNVIDLDGVKVNLISLKHLKINKRASGRNKDLADLENLP